MTLRLCTYNIEWFDDLFSKDNQLLGDDKSARRLDAIAAVLAHIDADLVGVVEGPNHMVNGEKKTTACLEAFAGRYGLRTRNAIIGWPSAGRQELGLIFDPAKVSIVHSPGGQGKKRPPFNKSLEFDTDDDRIRELYKFYRPPLEAVITDSGSGKSLHAMVVHTKSKGIFSSADYLHWERENRRNRRKLYAECSWVRQRVDEWLDAGHEVLVMGDINDGPGMDYYEFQFAKSAVEVIMGNLYAPDRILRSHLGFPEWGRYGWAPSSARFKDRLTETHVNVLIDHILVSRGVQVNAGSHIVWNPFQEAMAKRLKKDLLAASDHFPVSIDVTL